MYHPSPLPQNPTSYAKTAAMWVVAGSSVQAFDADGRAPGGLPPCRAGHGTPPATRFANLFAQLEVNAVDSGYAVDLGSYSAPDPPRNPDQPRYPARPGAGQRITGLRRTAGRVRHPRLAREGSGAEPKIQQQPV
jgi:hypothetical protein